MRRIPEKVCHHDLIFLTVAGRQLTQPATPCGPSAVPASDDVGHWGVHDRHGHLQPG